MLVDFGLKSITAEGKPVAGALITRTAIPNNDKVYTDSTKTDTHGNFRFERMTANSFLKILPGQSTVYQKIIIHYNDIEYLAWKTVLISERDKGELNTEEVIGTDKEIEINLKCELTTDKIRKSAANNVITGICSWDGQKVLD